MGFYYFCLKKVKEIRMLYLKIKIKFIYCHLFSWHEGPVKLVIKSLLVPLKQINDAAPLNSSVLDLGCGSGILTCLSAFCRPDLRIVGVDKVKFPNWRNLKKTYRNTSFLNRDVLVDQLGEKYDLILCNDFFHHISYRDQFRFFKRLKEYMSVGATLFLKDVDIRHVTDRVFTTFWDRRLYPDAPLDFRDVKDTRSLLRRCGFLPSVAVRLFSFWPASQTLILATKDGGVQSDLEGIAEFAAQFQKVAFVTGGTGFLGSNFIKLLLEKENCHWGIIALSREVKPEKLPTSDRLRVVTGDLFEVENYRRAIACSTHVFHFAAEVFIGKSKSLQTNNVLSTRCLLEAIAAAAAPPKLVFASTAGVHDRRKEDVELPPLSEDSPYYPLTDYGHTKRAAELLVEEYSANFVILRIPWAFGVGMLPKTHVRFICELAERSLIFRSFRFPARYNIMHAHHVAQVFLEGGVKTDIQNDKFLIADGENLSLGQLVDSYLDFTGKPQMSITLPQAFVRPLRCLRRFMPFQIQGLLFDILAINAAKFESRFTNRSRISRRQALYQLRHWIKASVEPKKLPVTVVTGASMGLGLELVKKYLKQGHSVVGVDKLKRNEDIQNPHYSHICCNLMNRDSLLSLVEKIEGESCFIDKLVNCAGLGNRVNLVSHGQNSSSEQEIKLNCLALTTLSEAVLCRADQPFIRREIVNIGSSSALQPLPFMSTYAATKSFVHSYSLGLQGEIREAQRENGIVVRCVVPSGFYSNFQSSGGVKTNPKEKLFGADVMASRILSKKYNGPGLEYLSARGRLMGLIAAVLPVKMQVILWAKLMMGLR